MFGQTPHLGFPQGPWEHQPQPQQAQQLQQLQYTQPRPSAPVPSSGPIPQLQHRPDQQLQLRQQQQHEQMFLFPFQQQQQQQKLGVQQQPPPQVPKHPYQHRTDQGPPNLVGQHPLPNFLNPQKTPLPFAPPPHPQFNSSPISLPPNPLGVIQRPSPIVSPPSQPYSHDQPTRPLGSGANGPQPTLNLPPSLGHSNLAHSSDPLVQVRASPMPSNPTLQSILPPARSQDRNSLELNRQAPKRPVKISRPTNGDSNAVKGLGSHVLSLSPAPTPAPPPSHPPLQKSSAPSNPKAPVDAPAKTHESVNNQISASTSGQKLDGFASVYRPAWLHAVNEDPNYEFIPHQFYARRSLLNYERWTSAFWPPALREEQATDRVLAKLSSHLQETRLGSHGLNGTKDRKESLMDDSWLGLNWNQSTSSEDEKDLFFHSTDSKEFKASYKEGRSHFKASFDKARLPSTEDLCPETYSSILTRLLDEELSFRSSQLAAQALFAVRLTEYESKAFKRGPYFSSSHIGSSGLFVIPVPGVRQDSPRLYSNDLLHLRPLLPDYSGRQDEGDNQSQGHGHRWAAMVLEASVSAVRTVEGTVVVKCDGIDHLLERYPNIRLEDWRFNVSFLPSEKAIEDSKIGLAKLGRIFEREGQELRGLLLKRWLFPDESSLVLEGWTGQSESGGRGAGREMSPRNQGAGELGVQGSCEAIFYDTELNEEQILTVKTLSELKPMIPYTISGPPGTGKTKTLVEATLQILRRQPDANILLCAPSNSAADTLTKRLTRTLKPQEMFRLNAPERTFAEVPEEILLYCHITSMNGNEEEEGGGEQGGPYRNDWNRRSDRDGESQASTFGLPDWKELLRKKVVICSTFDAAILLRAKLSNDSLGTLHHHILGGLYPQRPWSVGGRSQGADWRDADGEVGGGGDGGVDGVPRLHWTHLLIDEAGQSTEAELSTALACVLPSIHHTRRGGGGEGGDLRPTLQEPVIALCGDTAQLGPMIHSHQARSGGLDLSLLDRLTEREVYKKGKRRILISQRKSYSALRAAAAGGFGWHANGVGVSGTGGRESVSMEGALRGTGDHGSKGMTPSSTTRMMAAAGGEKDGGGDRGDPPPICSQLVRNYRSGHASLLMIPSNLFYSDLLIPCAKPTERIKGWKGLPNREVAIYFDNVKGKDIWVDEGVSWYNQAEINRIVEIIKSLTAAFEEEEEEEKVVVGEEGGEGEEGDKERRQPSFETGGANNKTSMEASWKGIGAKTTTTTTRRRRRRTSRMEQREIAVMTPFNEQVWRLRLALRGKGLGSVNVGPIEAFQGSEHSVSILSTVRSRARFLERDMERGLGLIFESKRFCVSITRAKEALIVVGDGEMLKVDPYWRVFLETCLRNRAWKGEVVEGLKPFGGDGVSRLERDLVHHPFQRGGGEERGATAAARWVEGGFGTKVGYGYGYGNGDGNGSVERDVDGDGDGGGGDDDDDDDGDRDEDEDPEAAGEEGGGGRRRRRRIGQGRMAMSSASEMEYKDAGLTTGRVVAVALEDEEGF